MQSVTYNVIFEGKIMKDRDPDEVKKSLAEFFKIETTKVNSLFSGKKIIIKKGLDRDTAFRYRALFLKAGAECRVLAQGGDKKECTEKDTGHRVTEENQIPAKKISTEEILAHFNGELKKTGVAHSYKIGLIMTGIAMIMIPVLYFLLICATGYAVFYHAVSNPVIFQSGMSKKAALLLYVAPLIIGSILILFMVKPFFIRFFDVDNPISLSPFKEERLYEFVRKICSIVGAPVPQKIEVNCHVNASASFNRGITSLFKDDLVLTIGLPLVAGLNSRQLAGVLAHEFGHFAQRAGMRFTYIIRTVNFWLSQAVYSRDIWDYRIEHWARTQDFRIGIILHLARFFIWLTRKILFLFMQSGLFISGWMSRQMEFDADQYEIEMAGSEVFAQTSRTLSILNAGNSYAVELLRKTWEDAHLVDDLPGLIKSTTNRFTEETTGKIIKNTLQRKTGFMDSHPCDSERIAQAVKAGSAGIFQFEIPAKDLFADFSSLSKRTTIHHYKNEWGMKINEKNLKPVDTLEGQNTNLQDSYKVLDSYLFGLFDYLRPIPVKLESKLAMEPFKERIEKLKKLITDLNVKAKSTSAVQKRFHENFNRCFQLFNAIAFLDAGVRFDHNTFRLKNGDQESVESALDKALSGKAELSRDLYAKEEEIALRFNLVFSLLDYPEMDEKIKDIDAIRKEKDRLLEAFTFFSYSLERLEELMKAFYPLASLARCNKDNNKSETYWASMEMYEKKCKKYIFELHYALKNVPYPFDHADGEISTSQFILGNDLKMDDVNTVGRISERAIEKMNSFHARVMGRLAAIAQEIETAVFKE